MADEVDPLPAQRIQAGQSLLRRLEDLGAATETSLDLPLNISFKDYEALGVALSRAHRAVTWMISDWLNHGEAVFKEKVYQAVEATGLNPDTLDNYARVARKVPRERRVPGVPFGVHAEVASLEPAQQTEWLGKAKANDWRREELRSHLRPIKMPDLEDDSHAGVVGSVEDAARELVRSAKHYGNDYLVHRPSFVHLCAALGEPF